MAARQPGAYIYDFLNVDRFSSGNLVGGPINLAAINLHAEGRPTSLASSTKYKPRGSAFSSLYLSNKRDSAGFSPCKKTLLGRFAIQNSHTAVRRVLDLGELWCDALRSRASANKTFAKGFGIGNNKITKRTSSNGYGAKSRARN